MLEELEISGMNVNRLTNKSSLSALLVKKISKGAV